MKMIQKKRYEINPEVDVKKTAESRTTEINPKDTSVMEGSTSIPRQQKVDAGPRYNKKNVTQPFDYNKYFEQVCRLCMSQFNQHEFEFIRNKKQTNFAKKILFCCNIAIEDMESCLPRRICATCIDSLEQAHTFRLRCLEYNQILLKMCNDAQSNIPPELPFNFSDSYISRNDLDIVKTEFENVDIRTIVEENFQVKEENTFEELVTEITIEENFQVKEENIFEEVDNETIVEEEFQVKEEIFIDGIDSLELEETVPNYKVESLPGNDRFFNECFQDGGNLKNGNYNREEHRNVENLNIQMHSIESDHSDSSEHSDFCCELCPCVCLTAAEYQLHSESHRLKPKRKIIDTMLLCQVADCKLEFSNFSDRRSHVIHCHKKEVFTGYLRVCPFCSFTVPLKTLQPNDPIKSHIRHKHTDEKHYCSECSYQSNNMTTLRTHMLRKHKENVKVECPHCKKLFWKYSLKKHINFLHNDNRKSPVCPLCDKKFLNDYNLRSHMRSHTGELPFKCPDCELAFSHNVSMKTHRLKVHHIDMFKKR